MIRMFGLVAAAVAALVFAAPSAEAAGKRRSIDPAISATAVGVGAAATATYFALNDWNWKWDSAHSGFTAAGAYAATSIGCMAVSPMVASAILKRPLKYREAGILMGSCIIPIVGGWLVNEAYNNGVFVAPDEAAPVKKKAKRRVAKK